MGGRVDVDVVIARVGGDVRQHYGIDRATPAVSHLLVVEERNQRRVRKSPATLLNVRPGHGLSRRVVESPAQLPLTPIYRDLGRAGPVRPCRGPYFIPTGQ